MRYLEVRFKDRIAEKWAPWFDGLELVTTPENETIVRGNIEDFSALHGLIDKISRFGLEPVMIKYEKVDANKSLE